MPHGKTRTPFTAAAQRPRRSAQSVKVLRVPALTIVLSGMTHAAGAWGRRERERSMPKNNRSTAAQRARAAARVGAKYTTQLRREQVATTPSRRPGEPRTPFYLSQVDMSGLMPQIDLTPLMPTVKPYSFLPRVKLSPLTLPPGTLKLITKIDVSPVMAKVDLTPLRPRIDMSGLMPRFDIVGGTVKMRPRRRRD